MRGFYDDNYTVANNARGSFGFEFTPTLSANKAFGQTDIGVRYAFGLFYYLQRDENGMDPMDYTHQAELWVDHSFNERWKLNVSDSLAMGQDPKLLDHSGSTIRVEGNNLANHANVKLDTEWTRQFSTSTHYQNSVYNFSQGGVIGSPSNPTEAALLNRVEQTAGIDFQWQFQPETMGFIGYQYSWVRYTENSQIHVPVTLLANGSVWPFLPPFPPGSRQVNYFSNSRDNNSHYGYVGVDHKFSPNLRASVRGGVSYTDLFNDPVSPSTSLSPYADVNVTYTFIPGSYVQAGFTHDMNATDVATPSTTTGHLTQYQESSVVYVDVNHRFTPKLSGSIVGQYQFSSFQEGAYNGTGDSQVSFSSNLSYQINRYLSTEIGYNFDELISSIYGRDNTRNRVYIGLSASY